MGFLGLYGVSPRSEEGWEPARWHRILAEGADGIYHIWMETSDRDEYLAERERLEANQTPYTAFRLYHREETEWRLERGAPISPRQAGSG
jgi:hypothetical protein